MKISGIPRALITILSLFTMVAMVSCGNMASDPLAGGGIGGTGISVGKITKFGSVWVNGVEFFETGGSNITINGTNVSQADLRIGMIVKVRGTFDASGKKGTFDTIEFKDNMQGPIASVDTTNNTFVVLGQNVIVDASTILENETTTPVSKVENNITSILDALNKAIGNIVEVSGFVEADNKTIRATYIELKNKTFTSGEDVIELKGTISNLDPDTKTFMIGDLKVDFSKLSISGLSDGLFVEVKSTTAVDSNGVLIASKVEVENQLPEHKEGDKAEIEGFVTSFDIASPNDFKVNGQPVRINQSTTFENGTVADIALNLKLEVKGTVDSNGVLIAQKISIETENENKGESDKKVSSNTSADTSDPTVDSTKDSGPQ